MIGTAISDGVNVLLTDIMVSVAATFTPRALPQRTLPTGVAVPCRAAIVRTDPVIDALRGPGARNPGWRITLNQREIPDAPREDDEIAILEGPWAGAYEVGALKEDPMSPRWLVEIGRADD